MPAFSTTSATSSLLAPSPGKPALRVSAIIPARNEEACIGPVIGGLLALRRPDGTPWVDEVIVANNASTDGTALVAVRAGATVVDVPELGYGQACWSAAHVARGHSLLFVDGDGAADPSDSPALLAALDAGADMVIGARHQPDRGSMSATQIFGNGLACALLRWVWGVNTLDLGPHRAITRHAYERIAMQDRGFGWTVEMQVRAHVLGLRVAELPVEWRVRSGGVSKISGTVQGVVGAGIGILGMVFRLWRSEQRRAALQLEPVAVRKSV